MHGQIDRTLSMLTYIRYNVSAMSSCLLFAAAEQQPQVQQWKIPYELPGTFGQLRPP